MIVPYVCYFFSEKSSIPTKGARRLVDACLVDQTEHGIVAVIRMPNCEQTRSVCSALIEKASVRICEIEVRPV